jgi:antitoxin (DNA-binding transcriptional repressor) of toxin-antitoxin stability system
MLKNKLSEYVRLAAAGETILITDRDRVVAELIPPTPGRSQMVDDAVLADLVRAGCLTPPILAPGGKIPRNPIAKLADLLRELDRDRADG